MTASSRTRAPSTTGGLLIIRVWLEPEHEVRLRARITRSKSADSSTGSEPHGSTGGAITVARTEDLLDVVRTWLESFVDPTPAVREHRQAP